MAHWNDKRSKEALPTADGYFSTEQSKTGTMKTLKQDELHHSLATCLNEKGLQEGVAARHTWSPGSDTWTREQRL